MDMGADKLILLTSAPGLLADPDDASSLVSHISAQRCEEMLGSGAIRGGMVPKLTTLVEAVRGGVPRAHILDGTAEHSPFGRALHQGRHGHDGDDARGREAVPRRMNVVELTRKLVSIPSISGNEMGCVEFLSGVLPEPTVVGRNIFASRGSGSRTLLLNSHTDTVPDSRDWTIDPWGAELADGKVHGLGANDAKGCLAALITAFLTVDLPADARLVLAATCDEEIGGDGLGTIREELGPLDAAIIGEPTTLEVCSCQRGMLRLRLHAHGQRAHASRPWQGDNAIEKAARDIAALVALELDEHPLLGPATLQVTMIEGGAATNVVPPSCTMEIDARTIPALNNEGMEAKVRAVVESEVEMVSNRFVPLETKTEEAIVQAALDGGAPRAFGGVSDFFHVRDIPAVVMGPGRSEQSHAADEWVEVSQLEAGVARYTQTILRYFE